MKTAESITITQAVIQEWMDEREVLSRQIDECRRRMDDCTRKIDAAVVLLPMMAQSEPLSDRVDDAGEASQSLVEKIVGEVALANGQALAPAEIKDGLKRRGQYPDGSSPNYFYSALKRAASRGLIFVKDGKYYARSEG